MVFYISKLEPIVINTIHYKEFFIHSYLRCYKFMNRNFWLYISRNCTWLYLPFIKGAATT